MSSGSLALVAQRFMRQLVGASFRVLSRLAGALWHGVRRTLSSGFGSAPRSPADDEEAGPRP